MWQLPPLLDAVSNGVSSEDDEEDLESEYPDYNYHIRHKNALHARVSYELVLLLKELVPSVQTLRCDLATCSNMT